MDRFNPVCDDQLPRDAFWMKIRTREPEVRRNSGAHNPRVYRRSIQVLPAAVVAQLVTQFICKYKNIMDTWQNWFKGHKMILIERAMMEEFFLILSQIRLSFIKLDYFKFQNIYFVLHFLGFFFESGLKLQRLLFIKSVSKSSEHVKVHFVPQCR